MFQIVIAGVLLVITGFYWNGRFVTVPNGSLIRVNDGQGDGFRLEREDVGEAPVRTVDLPADVSGEKLHIQFNFRAVQLVAGEKSWQDGRLILDWSDENGKPLEHDTLMSMKGNDSEWSSTELVVSGKSGLRPSLRIEHLGISGSLEVEGMRISAVRDRQGYQWFALVVIIAWGMWIFWVVGMLSKDTFPRRLLVSCILLGMGWFLAVPGPWQHYRPLVGKFVIGSFSDKVVTVVMPFDESKTANTPELLGEMPVQASWLYRIKLLLSYIRPVLHVVLFAVPAFVIAGLCGSRCAWWTLAMMALAVEGAQAAFWKNFDWVDVIDLLVDGLGIALGVGLVAKLTSEDCARFFMRLRRFS